MLDTPSRPLPTQPLDAAPLLGDDELEPERPPEQPSPPSGGRPPVNQTTAALGAGLSSAAAAWMVGGLFRDFSAHLVALLGVVIGGGFLLVAVRTRRALLLQYLVIPAALLAGLLLVSPDMNSGRTVIDLVRQAIQNGGLLQPPVSFDPGWRPILVVIFALVSAAAAGVGAGLRRPKLGVAVPAPLLLGAAIIEPPGQQVLGVVVALVLVVTGLTLAFGAELGSDGRVSAAFELPRLLRAGAIAGILAVGATGLSSLGFLFPQPSAQHTIPPQKPQQPPTPKDVPLFELHAPRPVPLALGVLDTYDPNQQAWLLPGYDATRLQRVHPPVAIPQAQGGSLPALTATITVSQADGHALPTVRGLQRIDSGSDTLTFDPQTQSIATADRPLYAGMTYSLTAAALDKLTAKQLDAAPAPPKPVQQYLQAPSPPNQVVALLQSCANQAQAAVKAGATVGLFDRLQCVRQGFYDKVVAAGTGVPTDVSPAMVGKMLDGGDASPFEITAAEALLARWAGVPSRIGYGYFDQKAQSDGTYEIRPANGAMWLEVYFDGYGWVPITGTPPKAKASLSKNNKQQTNATPPGTAQMIIYIPIQHRSGLLAFEYVRYWLLQLLPPVLAAILLLLLHPWFFKLARARRRRRWAMANGLQGRVVAAYCEFRDRARDLTVGDPSATPLRFLRFVEHDTEHRELAWLVTRSLWGDLRRDLRVEDAEAAEQMARSMARRLDRAQPFLNRAVARVARTSLRHPYSLEVPNLWYEREGRIHPLRNLGGGLRTRLRRVLRARRRRPALAGVAGAATLMLLLCSCGQSVQAAARPLDTALVPSQIGAYTFQREAKGEGQFASAGPDALVSGGLLYTIHATGATLGSVEVTVFKPGIDIEDINDERMGGHCTESPNDCQGHEVFKGFQANLGGGHFFRLYYDGERAYGTDLSDQRLYVWFPPGKQTMVILDLLSQFAASGAADDMFHALIDVEHGKTPKEVPLPVFKQVQESPSAQPSPQASPSGGAP